MHLAVLRAFGGRPPVGVVLFIEGEEEIGSPTLTALLAENVDLLRSDVIVIADSANAAVDVPSFTTSLRGLADLTVEVRMLAHPVHSGMFGGAVPDALTGLCRLLATLHDDARRRRGRRARARTRPAAPDVDPAVLAGRRRVVPGRRADRHRHAARAALAQARGVGARHRRARRRGRRRTCCSPAPARRSACGSPPATTPPARPPR